MTTEKRPGEEQGPSPKRARAESSDEGPAIGQGGVLEESILAESSTAVTGYYASIGVESTQRGMVKTPPPETTRTIQESPSSSSSGLVNHCGFGNVTVEVREVEGCRDRFEIYLPESRLKGEYGAKQGDHVSSYIALFQMVITACQYHAPVIVAKRLREVAIAVMPDKEEDFDMIYDLYKQEEGIYTSRETRKKFIEDLRTVQIWCSALREAQLPEEVKEIECVKGLSQVNFSKDLVTCIKGTLRHEGRLRMVALVRDMCNAFLENILPYEGIAFPRKGEFNPKQSNATPIKIAIHSLRALHDLTRIRLEGIELAREDHRGIRLNRFHEDDLETRLNHFHEDYLQPWAKYKDGLNALAGHDYVAFKRSEWEGLDADRSLNSEGLRERKANIVHAICEHTLQKLVAEEGIERKAAQLFMDAFDFLYEAHQEVVPGTLHKVVARHIVIMFLAFDQLQNYNVDPIIETFLQEGVLDRFGWKSYGEYKGNPEACAALKHSIMQFASLTPGQFFMKLQREVETEPGTPIYGASEGQWADRVGESSYVSGEERRLK